MQGLRWEGAVGDLGVRVTECRCEGGKMGKVPEYVWQSWGGPPPLEGGARDQELKVILGHVELGASLGYLYKTLS